MNSKAEISPDLLDRILRLMGTTEGRRQIRTEVNAILAAPVVERQEPVASIELVENKVYGGMHIVKWDNLGGLKDGVHLLYALPARTGIPVAWMDQDGALHTTLESAQFSRRPVTPLYDEQPAPVTVADKYDDTLLPFVALMRKELHANAGKGDRPGWLSMSSDTALLEIIYHFGKLQASVKRGDEDGIREYSADVANMCMMLVDICGGLDKVKELDQ